MARCAQKEATAAYLSAAASLSAAATTPDEGISVDTTPLRDFEDQLTQNGERGTNDCEWNWLMTRTGLWNHAMARRGLHRFVHRCDAVSSLLQTVRGRPYRLLCARGRGMLCFIIMCMHAFMFRHDVRSRVNVSSICECTHL